MGYSDRAFLLKQFLEDDNLSLYVTFNVLACMVYFVVKASDMEHPN